MVRKAASSSLGRLEDSSAFDELISMVQTDRTEVRRSAAWALSRLAQAKNVLPENLIKLKDFFVQLIDSTDPDIIGIGCSGIAGLAKAGFGKLHDLMSLIQSLLDHSDSGVCHSAAYAISHLAELEDLPLLQSMATNSDPNVRASAASGLGRLKQADSTALLVKLFTDRDIRVKNTVNWALHQLPDQQLVEVELIKIIKTVDEQTVARLMSGSKKYKAGDHKIVIPDRTLAYRERDAIKTAMQDRALVLLESKLPIVLSTACQVFQRQPDSRAIEPCLELLKDDDPRVRASACAVLQKLPDKRAIEPCLELLKDDDPRVRASACAVLQKLPDKRAIEQCLILLNDPDAGVRASACSVFEQFPDPRAVDPCINLLIDEDSRVRASALNVLQRLPDECAIVPGLKLLKDDDPGVRASACGLAAMLPLPPKLHAPVLQALQKLINDPDKRVVRSAKFAIRALTQHGNIPS